PTRPPPIPTLTPYTTSSDLSLKEVQSHITWLMMLPMVPALVLMANPVKTQAWQFAVPFLAQYQMLLRVIRGEHVAAQEWAIYFGCSLGLALLLWLAAVLRYRQEKLAISG